MAMKRTQATSLTDDQLILLDVLFEGGRTPAWLLRKDVFHDQWLHFPHEFEQHQLVAVLDQMVQDGVLASSICQDEGRFFNMPCYQMTRLGGELWSSERKADWSRYATERYDELPSGRPYVMIIATTIETLDNFWAVGCESSFFAYTTGRVKRAVLTRIHNCNPIRWIPFPKLHLLTAELDHWMGGLDPENKFDAKRQFWRTASELMKFFETSPR